MEKLGTMGEHEVIRRLVAGLGAHADLVVGAGDDCAVCRLLGTELDQVFTTDPTIEQVHFLPLEKPERIGNKAVGRVLSDLAAMGARPQWLLVNVVAPPEQDFQALEKIYEGMNALCSRFGATIIGGDLAQGACLELHVFGTGILPKGSALLRSGGRVGDGIFITGALGDSRRGKHLDFIPRVEEGIFLRESGLVNAMMDVSDGLATDLRHILQCSGVGAVLDAENIPKVGTLEQALFDGEDFELLFTVSEENQKELLGRWRNQFPGDLSRIGTLVSATDGLCLQYADGKFQSLGKKGHEHFREG